MAEVPNYRGCFMSDELKGLKPKETENMIINYDKNDGEGTHWVCLIKSKNLPYNFFFDSFGSPPSTEIEEYMLSSKKPIVYNSSQIQDISSDSCGWYCMQVIKEFNASKGIYDILYHFDPSNPPKNDNLLV